MLPDQPKYYRQDFATHNAPAGGYLDRQGLASAGTSAGLKPSKMYIPNTFWTWTFMLVALIQAILSLSLEAYVFAKFQNGLIPAAQQQGGSDVKTIPTYLALLIFGFVYELLLVYDALRAKNTIQVIGIVAMNLAIMVYTAVQGDQIHDAFLYLTSLRLFLKNTNFWNDVRPYLIALPCLTALGTFLLAICAWKLYEEFAWTIYKQISADVRLKNRFLIYQIYIALLKFDFFLFLGFIIQFLVIVHNTSDAEFYLTVAALPVTLVMLLLAAWSTQREHLIGMIVTIFMYFVGLAYFIFKLVRMYAADSQRRSDYAPARKTLTIFAVITIVFLLITIVIACWCTRNFNKGLKPHISKSHVLRHADANADKLYMNDVRTNYTDAQTGLGPSNPSGGHRMEID
ncbi:uncharacterized protein PV09_00542 [Verruconis gallopava]|uniref:Uncharacterized protein n=1 Tax=Verruconis gallopava TaxID=253628 RepID=A0A0D2APG5_9PEZI|nr:uncharacterized protein PV09_00542 [Verruconis gallopava]KIW08578.1 hypothetical protein PV09_00542 [Verruconis gallopava]